MPEDPHVRRPIGQCNIANQRRNIYNCVGLILATNGGFSR